MRISVEADLQPALAALQNLVKEQVPFATTYALTQTAKAAQSELERATLTTFDRPTRYVQRSFRTRPATKRRLVAEVDIKDGKATSGVSRDAGGKPVKVLAPHVSGGRRALKPFENLLRARGLLPPGWFAVAGRDAVRDQFGNVPASTINRVLSQLQAHSVYNIDRNETAKSKARQFRSRTKRLQRYFVSLPGQGHLQPGIWERTTLGFGSAIRPLFIYVQRAPVYRKVFAFERIVERTVSAVIADKFREGAEMARMTAR